jgi:glycosyltransferase involved in cell wall biosynthesis
VTLYERAEGVEAQVRRGGFDVRRLRSRRTMGRVRELREILSEERPDLVHSTIFESNLAARLAARGSAIPVVTSLVNVLYTGQRVRDPRLRRWKLRAARSIDARTARRLTTHFHAITEAVKRAAVATMGIPEERVTVIWRGRDAVRLGRRTPERRARSRANLGLDDSDEILVNVARHEYQKGHRVLLDAMARLAPRRARLIALVAGRTGAETPFLRRRHEELGLGDRFRFLGHIDDLPELLAAADVFVFPSLWEGLGGSLIEAMALELPVVASDDPAIREVVEEEANAFLVPPADAAALAQTIEALLDDRARREAFGRASRQRFEERFTLEQSAAKMIDLYRRILAG